LPPIDPRHPSVKQQDAAYNVHPHHATLHIPTAVRTSRRKLVRANCQLQPPFLPRQAQGAQSGAIDEKQQHADWLSVAAPGCAPLAAPPSPLCAYLVARPSDFNEGAAAFVRDAAELPPRGVEHARLHDPLMSLGHHCHGTSVACAHDALSVVSVTGGTPPAVPVVERAPLVLRVAQPVPLVRHRGVCASRRWRSCCPRRRRCTARD
jgi:hypothetical protein